MSEPIFECANIPVAVASKALKVDCQTVRLLLVGRLCGNNEAGEFGSKTKS